jgi:hypothetical protein
MLAHAAFHRVKNGPAWRVLDRASVTLTAAAAAPQLHCTESKLCYFNTKARKMPAENLSQPLQASEELSGQGRAARRKSSGSVAHRRTYVAPLACVSLE